MATMLEKKKHAKRYFEWSSGKEVEKNEKKLERFSSPGKNWEHYGQEQKKTQQKLPSKHSLSHELESKQASERSGVCEQNKQSIASIVEPANE